jgi:hypothetical protein
MQNEKRPGDGRMEELISASVQQVKALRANRRKSLGREPELGKSRPPGRIVVGELGL